MVAAARWIAKLSTPCLLKALDEYPDYKVKVLFLLEVLILLVLVVFFFLISSSFYYRFRVCEQENVVQFTTLVTKAKLLMMIRSHIWI